MLKKCLKHEWKACWKNLTLLNGAAVFMGAVGGWRCPLFPHFMSCRIC